MAQDAVVRECQNDEAAGNKDAAADKRADDDEDSSAASVTEQDVSPGRPLPRHLGDL